MKKLLFICPHLSTGGQPQVLVKRLEVLKDVYDIYVVEYSNISDSFIVQKNRVKNLVKPGNFFTLGDDKWELLNIIKRINPDIIHFEETPEISHYDLGLMSEIFTDDRKYKIFTTTHSSDFDIDKTIFYPDKFLFVSQFNSFRYVKLGVPIDVVEYPTDPIVISDNTRNEYRKELGLSDDYIHVLNVGLFTPRKNQAYAIEIAKLLQNEKIIFHFVGNQADNFKHYWGPLLKNPPKNCKIWGERSDVQKFYDACDIFLFTSRGFKYDKELNPLVIKEAIASELPQLLFPLDVYCGKYDDNPWVTYLDGDINKDVEILKNMITEIKSGKYENLDWVVEEKTFEFNMNNEIVRKRIKEYENDKSNVLDFDEEMNKIDKELEGNKKNDKLFDNKYKVKAVHLLLNGDKRNRESIDNISPIQNYDVDYIQHFNDRYTDIPPRDNCYRPQDVGRLGPYALNGPHYGNYTSFKNAIEREFTEDTDFLMLFEGDCVLKIDIETFIKRLKVVFDIMFYNDISYMSLGDKHNLMTGELISLEIEKIPGTDLMYVTDRIIGIQSIIFSKYCRNFLLNTYKNEGWDVSDLYFNRIFPKNLKKAIVKEALTTQSEGNSSIDNVSKQHFNKRGDDEFTSDDIKTQYNKYDKRIYIVFEDVYRKEIEVYLGVKDKSGSILYNKLIKFTPHDAVWIGVDNIETYDRLYIDFISKDTRKILFTKDVIIDEKRANVYSDSDELSEFNVDNVSDDITVDIDENKFLYENINENSFEIKYNYDEKRVYLKYYSTIKTAFNMIVKEVSNDNVIIRDTILCCGDYFNWFYNNTNHNNTDGYKIEIYDPKDNLLFTKNIYFERKKIILPDTNTEPINNVSEKNTDDIKPWFAPTGPKMGSLNTDDELIIVSTYPNTKIKEDVTIECINSLRKLGRKILLTSHYPVSNEIQKLVDYYIYDSYNPVIDHSFYRFMWRETTDYKVDINFSHLNNVGKNQSLTVLNNIYNSFNFAKSLGFKRIFSFTYDFILNDKDSHVIELLNNKINNENKHGYLMKFKDSDLDTIKSVFFVSDVDTYLDIFIRNYRTPETFNRLSTELGSENFLENVFYHMFKHNLGKYVVEETTEEKLFPNSNINIFSECEYLTVLPVKDNDDLFAIWYSSSNKTDNRKIIITIYGNDKLIKSYLHNIEKQSHFYKVVRKYDNINYKIVFEFIDGETKYKDDIVYNLDDIQRNGLFTMKNTSPIFERKNITCIIDYNTDYYDSIKKKIDYCRLFSNDIIIPVFDKYDRSILDKTYKENDYDDVKFLEFESDDNLKGLDEDKLFELGRKLSKDYIDKDSEYIVVIKNDIKDYTDVRHLYNIDDNLSTLNNMMGYEIIKK